LLTTRPHEADEEIESLRLGRDRLAATKQLASADIKRLMAKRNCT